MEQPELTQEQLLEAQTPIVHHTLAWHQHMMNQGHAFATQPYEDFTGVENADTGEIIQFTEDEYRAFQQGMLTILTLISRPPFEVETKNTSSDEAP